KGYRLRYRPHPRNPSLPFSVGHDRIDPANTSVEQDLADPDVAVAITYNSTAGLAALMAGVPVECAPAAHYFRVADLQDRDALLRHLHKLAHAQWTCDELRTGDPLLFMARYLPRLLPDILPEAPPESNPLPGRPSAVAETPVSEPISEPQGPAPASNAAAVPATPATPASPHRTGKRRKG